MAEVAAAGKKRKRSQPSAKPEKDGDELIDLEMENPDYRVPSFARRTEKGGYAHTSFSRKKIGQANKGNIPWNKGKNRSEESKAKIGMAVRARNQAILEANLKQIGMTQEEYDEMKVKLKYARERVRKVRTTVAERAKNQQREREMLENYLKYGHPKDEEEESVAQEIEETNDEQEEEDEEEDEDVVSDGKEQPTMDYNQAADTSETVSQYLFVGPETQYSPIVTNTTPNFENISNGLETNQSPLSSLPSNRPFATSPKNIDDASPQPSIQHATFPTILPEIFDEIAHRELSQVKGSPNSIDLAPAGGTAIVDDGRFTENERAESNKKKGEDNDMNRQSWDADIDLPDPPMLDVPTAAADEVLGKNETENNVGLAEYTDGAFNDENRPRPNTEEIQREPPTFNNSAGVTCGANENQFSHDGKMDSAVCETNDEIMLNHKATKDALRKPKSSANKKLSKVFKREIRWDAHSYDDPNVLYNQLCPKGGPGGLICCSHCAASYSSFLLETQQNLEDEQIRRVRQEVTTLSQFLSQTTTRLKESVAAAQKRPPPMLTTPKENKERKERIGSDIK
ncbi:hypothetical protein ACA910_016931 [Epithemia clementina (nom. ined.)]